MRVTDHIVGEKLAEVTRLIHNLDRCLEEVDKCEVVCANCHRIRSKNRLEA